MGTLNQLELVKCWMRRVDQGPPAERFRAFAMALLDAPYVWGAENPEGSDCSGTVCFPLWCMGFDIRVTADVLYKNLFTLPVADEEDLSKVMAVFYITREARQHFDRMAPANSAVHVTPVVGHNVVLNAGTRLELATAREIRVYFESRGCDAVWRSIDWEKARAMSDSKQYAWDVDPVLKMIRG